MSQNPYQTTTAYPQTSEFAKADERTTFIRKTYLHLLGAILACAAL